MASLTQLQYLVAVDRFRHFGKAAEACHVSQPTLSMQLQKLEDEFEVTLFDRDKQPVIPTREGRPIIEQAKAVLHEAGKLEFIGKNTGRARSAGLGLTGELRLGIIPTIAPYLLPRFLGSFAKRYPGIELSLEEMTTGNIVLALENDQIDAGILATPLGTKRLTEKPLYYEPFFLYLNATHELAKLDQIREDRLDAKDIWLLAEGHCLRNQIVKICSPAATPGIFPNVRFASGSLETIINLVDRGHGYTLLPYLATVDLRRAHKAQLKPFAKPVPSREVSLVYRRNQYKKTLFAALAEEIKQNLPADLPQEKSRSIEIVKIEG